MTEDKEIFELDETTKLTWYKIVFALKKQFGKKPDMNGLLFLIGTRELGRHSNLSKEEKMDLMHVAVCKLLSLEGYYELTHHDADGWPHYKLVKAVPYADLMKQENVLKRLVVKYFVTEDLLEDE